MSGPAGTAILLAVLGLLVFSAGATAGPPTGLRPLAKTPLPLGDIVSDGGRLLYVAEHTGQIDWGDPSGGPLRPFVTLP